MQKEAFGQGAVACVQGGPRGGKHRGIGKGGTAPFGRGRPHIDQSRIQRQAQMFGGQKTIKGGLIAGGGAVLGGGVLTCRLLGAGDPVMGAGLADGGGHCRIQGGEMRQGAGGIVQVAQGDKACDKAEIGKFAA